MDQRLRRELSATARDRSSGAAELTQDTCAALQKWIRRHSNIRRNDLQPIVRALLLAQPAMAPLLRVANEVALAADDSEPSRRLARSLSRFAFVLRTGPERIAARFSAALRGEGHNIITTYSYSSTVLHAIVAARSRIWQVICSEGRPGLEGRKTVEQVLRRAKGVGACLTTDAALHLFAAHSYALVVGADSLEETGFTNKAGTGALVAHALQIGRPVWVLAGTSKLLPREIDAIRADRNGPDSEIWAAAPKRLSILNPYFEKTPYAPGVRILTENGWKTPAQICREIRKIKVSPLLETLAHAAD
ncbi:MAG TPA: hypothetical protein VGU63_01085 [Candidatus Acidoferrales bacterium]|nr:hypothetical protein [Candidatus Acidoferrales bacterium]